MQSIKAAFSSLFHAHERISYRRLLAFGTGTYLLTAGKLTSEEWVMIAVAFIAGEAAPKILGAIRK